MDETARRKLMQRIQVASFCLEDIKLYLDTHPTCPYGLEYFDRMRAQNNQLRDEYIRAYGPISANDSINSNTWAWGEMPNPWEMEA